MTGENSLDNFEDAGLRAADFAKSEMFLKTFREGMALVEETAGYLDGDGRADAKSLSREAALAYAGESMRLTTRLMQIASWLLVQRAVREGDMTPEDAKAEKYRLGLEQKSKPLAAAESGEMPEILKDLIARSERLHRRVQRLDESLYQTPAAAPETGEVARQLQALQDAYKKA